jgi:hypothetical protein
MGLKTKHVKFACIAALPLAAVALLAQQVTTLAVNGQSGHASVVQVQGRNYVDIEGLARILNGSISFNGPQIVLALPGSSPAPAADSSQTPGLSKGFLNAGIEAMTTIREWHAALRNAIERSYPISDDWIAPLRRQAQENLRLTQVAISTDADRNAYPLLVNEFNNMNKLSDGYLQMAKNLTYIDPNSLSNDPMEQRLIACGHSLVGMVSSGQFVDDGSCH